MEEPIENTTMEEKILVSFEIPSKVVNTLSVILASNSPLDYVTKLDDYKEAKEVYDKIKNEFLAIARNQKLENPQ